MAMGRGEAERILGLSGSPYSFDDLRAARRRHMAEHHPDRFPEEPVDGKPGKEEAQREFVRGAEAYDALKALFRGKDGEYKVTPVSMEAREDGEDTASRASARAASSGYAAAYQEKVWEYWREAQEAEARHGQSEADGDDPAAEESRHGGDATGQANQGKTSRDSGQRPSTGASHPVPGKSSSLGKGNVLRWVLLVAAVLLWMRWNMEQPEEAFVFAVNLFVHPERIGTIFVVWVLLGFWK